MQYQTNQSASKAQQNKKNNHQGGYDDYKSQSQRNGPTTLANSFGKDKRDQLRIDISNLNQNQIQHDSEIASSSGRGDNKVHDPISQYQSNLNTADTPSF